jgi:hypothetical protein
MDRSLIKRFIKLDDKKYLEFQKLILIGYNYKGDHLVNKL